MAKGLVIPILSGVLCVGLMIAAPGCRPFGSGRRCPRDLRLNVRHGAIRTSAEYEYKPIFDVTAMFNVAGRYGIASALAFGCAVGIGPAAVDPEPRV